MKPLAPVALLALACTQLTGDFGEVVAIELLSPPSVELEEGQADTLAARAIDIEGNPIADAVIRWEVIRRDTLPVGITLDTAAGIVVGTSPGRWDVRARVEQLPTNPVSVRITPAPDSIAAIGDTAVTVPAASVQSGLLLVNALDLTTLPGTTTPLVGKLLSFEVTFPTFAPGARSVALVGGTVAADSLSAVVPTSSQGGGVLIRRSGTPQPDSVVIDVTAMTAIGGPVAGTPLRFVVHFPIN